MRGAAPRPAEPPGVEVPARGRPGDRPRPGGGRPAAQGTPPGATRPAVREAQAGAPARALPPLRPAPNWPGPPGPDGAPLLDAKGLLPDELASLLASWGEPAYRGRQLFQWLHAKGARGFAEMTVLPAALRQRVERLAVPTAFTLLTRQADPQDGTVKYLFELADGQTVETVLMRYRYGYTACVSSQVGCRMGCRFCASTLGGLKRNLLAGEMAEQIAFLNRDLAQRGDDREAFPVPEAGPEEPGALEAPATAAEAAARWRRVSRLVVMGMGEPLENLDAVERFLRVVHEPTGAGIGMRHITVSTAGVVPGIDRLAELALPITLAISLHAPNDALRDGLVPLNRRYPLRALLDACQRYVDRTGRRLTFEYVLIAGVNDLPEHARELGRLLRGLPCHINLIPLNPVAEWGLQPSSAEATARFQGLLHGAGLPVTLRRQLGTAIDAACGQLRRRGPAAEAGAAGPEPPAP